MLLLVASLWSSKILHSLIGVLPSNIIIDCGKSIPIFLYEYQVWKLFKTGHFDIYLDATRAKIFFLCVMLHAEDLEKRVGRKFLVTVDITP